MSDKMQPLLSYYGDDFTGSTDVMEAMASHGFPSVLFLSIPSESLLSRFGECKVIGIAGTSRSESTEWMDENLTEIFQWLKSLNAVFCHYKVCSTFDSSPTTGNIGRAIEIGKKIFRQQFVPLIVGAPQLKRYTAFGHLFAAYQGSNYRIDRHPVMSRHPVTPMREADLRIHLAEQSGLDSQLVDLSHLHAADQQVIDSITSKANGIVLFDVDSESTQQLAGSQLQQTANQASFVAGSSGIEYALLAHWRQCGELKDSLVISPADSVDRIAVVSGSVSPTTERQINHAALHGFECIPVNPLSLISENSSSTIEAIVLQANSALARGLSPLIHTALGPEDNKAHELDNHPEARHRIGRVLGRILRQIIEMKILNRVVIAGGDTSSHALQELKIEALTLLMPIPSAPGSPLCICHGPNDSTNGLQIALKGGQVGDDSYFSMIRNPALMSASVTSTCRD